MRAVAYDNTCIGYKKMECFRRLVDNISMQFCESNDRTQAQKRRPSHKHFKHIDIRLTENLELHIFGENEPAPKAVARPFLDTVPTRRVGRALLS
jgi:hypothetical protein